jgi:hypothetical protein
VRQKGHSISPFPQLFFGCFNCLCVCFRAEEKHRHFAGLFGDALSLAARQDEVPFKPKRKIDGVDQVLDSLEVVGVVAVREAWQQR